ncbi:MAG: RES family NAD+ phosphorylase [Proteobacteria bacterium]|nr:RES family NAD+ phosphorylase [Pseudomonadota bacterium]
MYLASSEALAVLELRVHLGSVVPRDPYALIEIDCPQGLVATLPRSRWPRRWDAVPFNPATQRLGDRWLAAGRSALLRVPSVHSGSDFNVLLNPAHPDARRVKLVSRKRYEFDARLF